MIGNWRTSARESKVRIRNLNKYATPCGGLIDPGLVNGPTKRRKKPEAPYKRPNRPKNRKELANAGA